MNFTTQQQNSQEFYTLVVVNSNELVTALKYITLSDDIKLYKSKNDNLIYGAKIKLTNRSFVYGDPALIYRRLSEINCVKKIETNNFNNYMVNYIFIL
jgi:hypothetical protein